MECRDVVGRVLLECYGTVNWNVLQPIFAPFANHVQQWYYWQTNSAVDMLQFAADMYYIVDDICNMLSIDATHILFRRLEEENLIQPYGSLQTVLAIVYIGRFWTSKRDMLYVLRAHERSPLMQDLLQDGYCTDKVTYVRDLLLGLQVVYDLAFPIVSRLFGGIPNRQRKKRQPKKPLRCCYYAMLFITKLRMRTQKNTALVRHTTPRLFSTACAVLFVLRLKRLQQLYRAKAARKQHKKERKRIQDVFQRQILPELVRYCADAVKKPTSPKVAKKELLKKYKMERRRHQHYFRYTVLPQLLNLVVKPAETIVQEPPPQQQVRIHLPPRKEEPGKYDDDSIETRVQVYLFSKPDSVGNQLYWEYRFTLFLLSNLSSCCQKILLHLAPNKSEWPTFMTHYAERVQVLCCPYENNLAGRKVDTTSPKTLFLLLRKLGKGNFNDRLQTWMRADTNIRKYETCLGFFELMLDIFANMQRCLQRVPCELWEHMIWCLYNAFPSQLDPLAAFAFHGCKARFPQFKGMWVVVQKSLGLCIDRWLLDGYQFDLIDFIRLAAKEQGTYVITKEPNTLKQTLRAKIQQMRKKR